MTPGVPIFLTNNPWERFCPLCELEMTRDGLYCWRCGWEAWQRIDAARERHKRKNPPPAETERGRKETMKVKELRDLLATLPDDMDVILQKDSEGNGYSPLSCADPDCIYVPESTWSGEVYNAADSADDCCMETEEWEEMKRGPRALVLAPVN